MTTDEFADEILGRCRERIERGETVDPEEVIRAHPEIASRLRDRFAALALLDATFARATTPAPAAPSLAGRRVGRYRLDAPLGAGGMGAVWLATADDGARVAVKIVHPHLAARVSGSGRFEREAELGRRVRHENVVATLDAGEHVEDGATLRFLVMEHVEGRTLRALLDEAGKLPEELCRHVGREIAKGLAAVHAQGAVHRDLKPENVMITRGHVVKVMDLGVARVDGDAARLSQTGAFVGSLHYAAPEQLTSADDVDARADLHALGALLYELATGAHPFGGGEVGSVVRRVLDETPRRAGAVDPQISPLFEELLAHLLEKDREKRPARAADVAAILVEGESSAWWRERSATIRRETRRPLRRIRIARETEIFGRDAELARLRALFDKAKAGDGQVVLVEGEAGIGKSRLVDEFVLSLWAAGEEIDFLFGSWPPGGAATAAGALATAYREHLGEDGLEHVLHERLGAAHALAPAFAALLSGLPSPVGAEPLTKDALAACFVHVTRSLAAERTTVVLADDLHFAPAEGRALFSSLAHAAPGHRVLLVGTARPEVDEKWVGELARAGAARLPLARLGPKDLIALLRDAMRSDHLAGELGAKIAEKSDGNPFFVFEILRGLREGKFLARKPDGTWVTTREISDIEVPPSIVEVVQARVSELDRADRDALEAAACVGFEFDAALVGDVLDVAPIPLLQRLGAIEKRTRLVRSVGRRFAFDHHQVQEVLYAGLSEPLREEYHAAIGTAIEARAGAAAKEAKDLDGALCVELARHFLTGARGPRALRYLDAALTHLTSRYLNEAAVGLAERALAAPGLFAGKARCELLLRLCNGKGPLDYLSRRSRQEEAAREAQRLAEEGSHDLLRGRTALALAIVLERTSRGAEAETRLRGAIEFARARGDARNEADLAGSLGASFHSRGRFAEAREQFERSLALSREIGYRQGECNATVNLGNVFEFEGRHAQARELQERGVSVSREIGDRQIEAHATLNLGNSFKAEGRLVQAREHYERSLAISREIGLRQCEASCTGNLGVVFQAEGRFAQAVEWHERAVVLRREHGHRQGEAIHLVNLGPLRLALGDRDRARAALLESLRICREIGARYPEGYALAGLSDLADEDGDAAAAFARAVEALALRRAIGHGDGVAASLIQVGDLHHRSGEIDAARAALDEAATLSRKRGYASHAALALAGLACLPGGDAQAALSALAESGASEPMPRARFLLWRATGDRAHLVEAKRLLDRLVAHAPAECRESMLANVRLHREIAEAARANGV